ncbi:hypothetical protein HPB48_020068 [Haemaphysalis longicornis]|uniref:Uncharacterized protein n=1 Tax=Haemaphysalis longicornis TaxID=44386 RepID=A0A9J6GC20_HAELO|nr:hypothetical protein HPB48_020068 [Haemaphysalis longicornis]
MMHKRRVLRTMVRDNSTHREAAASVRRRRRSSRRRRRRSRSISCRRDLQTTAAPPLAPHPQVLTQEEPRPPQVTPLRASNASVTVSADDWPLLPQTASAANKLSIVVKGPHDKHSDEERLADEKVLRMLKQLLNTMRKLIAGMESQSAKIVVQVLDALEPLIEALLVIYYGATNRHHFTGRESLQFFRDAMERQRTTRADVRFSAAHV